MSLFDDINDDSIIELPLFERIKAKTNEKYDRIEDSLDSSIAKNEELIETTDKSNETFTIESDSDQELNHSFVANEGSNDDSIEVLFTSPIDQNKDSNALNDNKPIEDIDCNTSMRSIGSIGSTDWTPIKPKFIGTPFVDKRNKNCVKSSVKKSINFLNKKQLNEEKAKEREDRNRQKNEIKAQKELLKKREKSEKEVLKSKDIKESIKYCFAIIDQNLYQLIKQFFDEIFTKNQCNYRLTDSPMVPMSVTWIRKCLNLVEEEVESGVTSQSSQTSIANIDVQQNHILVVIECNDFISRVHSFVTNSGETLFDFVKQIIQKSGIKNITLLVFKLEQYFKRQKTKSQNQFRQRFNELNSNETNSNQNCRQNRRNSMPFVTKEDIDSAQIDLEFKLNQLDPQSKVSLINGKDCSDISTLIYRYTKSVAESVARKEKRLQDNTGWFADADNRNTVDPIDAQSHQKLWIKQLMQFTKVSHQIANSIALVYPTPQALLDRYSRESEPQLLLSDILVSRRQPNGTTERRIGPKLSATIHLFMTTRDGNQLLNDS